MHTREYNTFDDIGTILEHAHAWKWAPDWVVLRDIYAQNPDGAHADIPSFSSGAWETSERDNKKKAGQKKVEAQKVVERGKATLGDEVNRAS